MYLMPWWLEVVRSASESWSADIWLEIRGARNVGIILATLTTLDQSQTLKHLPKHTSYYERATILTSVSWSTKISFWLYYYTQLHKKHLNKIARANFFKFKYTDQWVPSRCVYILMPRLCLKRHLGTKAWELWFGKCQGHNERPRFNSKVQAYVRHTTLTALDQNSINPQTWNITSYYECATILASVSWSTKISFWILYNCTRNI